MIYFSLLAGLVWGFNIGFWLALVAIFRWVARRLPDGVSIWDLMETPDVMRAPKAKPAPPPSPFVTDWDIAQEPEGRVDYRFLGVMGDGQDS